MKVVLNPSLRIFVVHAEHFGDVVGEPVILVVNAQACKTSKKERVLFSLECGLIVDGTIHNSCTQLLGVFGVLLIAAE